jgi:transcriptional regulator with GAF, ATPase, and Fis domain
MVLRKFLLDNPVGVLILGVLTGLATNLLSSLAPILYPFLAQAISIQLWTVIIFIALGFFLAFFPASFALKKTRQAIELEHKTEKNIIEIDRTLLDSLSKLAKGNDPGSEFDILATSILNAISNIHEFSGSGISIFCPDPKDNDYLVPWKSCHTESQSTAAKFYIGSISNIKRGTAGEVYKDKRTIIVHIDVDSGQIKSDDGGFYVVFPGQGIPRYRSFMCVPVIDTDGNSLGVLSIDSQDRTAFDSDKVQELVNLIANRLGAILLVTLNILPKP